MYYKTVFDILIILKIVYDVHSYWCKISINCKTTNTFKIGLFRKYCKTEVYEKPISLNTERKVVL